MIKIENVVLPSPEQWEAVIRGMRNPKNSWDRMDSCFCSEETSCWGDCAMCLGKNDLKLMNQLAAGGPVHAKYRRMIPVYLDITAPLYWWKEFDTYKVGTVTNSCSTMHKIHAKEFTLEDFSREHLSGEWLAHMTNTIKLLNNAREAYNWCNTDDKKEYWWQMIQLLPSSYNQKRTVMLNYEVLVGIYKWRRNHKLDEWEDFCDWIESLPYSELITGKEG